MEQVAFALRRVELGTGAVGRSAQMAIDCSMGSTSCLGFQDLTMSKTLRSILPAVADPLLGQPSVLHHEDENREHDDQRCCGNLAVQDDGVRLRETYLSPNRNQSQLNTPRYSHGDQQQLSCQDKNPEPQSPAEKHPITLSEPCY